MMARLDFIDCVLILYMATVFDLTVLSQFIRKVLSADVSSIDHGDNCRTSLDPRTAKARTKLLRMQQCVNYANQTAPRVV